MLHVINYLLQFASPKTILKLHIFPAISMPYDKNRHIVMSLSAGVSTTGVANFRVKYIPLIKPQCS